MLTVPCFFNKLLHVWVSCGLFRPNVGICFHTFYIFPTSYYIVSTYLLPNLHSTYFLQFKKAIFKAWSGAGSGAVAISRFRLQLGQKRPAPAPQPWLQLASTIFFGAEDRLVRDSLTRLDWD